MGILGLMEVQEGLADAIPILLAFLANVERILTILEPSNLMVFF